MTDTKKLCHFDFSLKNQTDEDENKTSSVSKNLEPFINFNYFNEVNTFNECLGGYEDFTNTYHSVNKKLEEEREEEEMRSFYKEVIYTMTPAQEDAFWNAIINTLKVFICHKKNSILLKINTLIIAVQVIPILTIKNY